VIRKGQPLENESTTLHPLRSVPVGTWFKPCNGRREGGREGEGKVTRHRWLDKIMREQHMLLSHRREGLATVVIADMRDLWGQRLHP